MMQYNPELLPSLSDRQRTVGEAKVNVELAYRTTEIDAANTEAHFAWPNTPIGPKAVEYAHIDPTQPSGMVSAVQPKEKPKDVIQPSLTGETLNISELSQQASAFAPDRGTIEDYLNAI